MEHTEAMTNNNHNVSPAEYFDTKANPLHKQFLALHMYYVDYPKEAIALHFIFVLQLFAHHFSIARGKNPDSPGKLLPFIT